MTTKDSVATTQSATTPAPRKRPTAVATNGKLLIALIAALPAVDAVALPKAPFPDPLPWESFDPNTPWTPPGPVDPGGGLPPLYATAPKVDSRTHDSVTLSFHNSAEASIGVAIERSAGRDGKFESIRCWNTNTPKPLVLSSKTIANGKTGVASPSGNGCEDAASPGVFTDSVLASDNLFCYRTRVWDAAGSSVASPSVCAYTRGFAGDAAGDPAVTPWRARLVVETGTASNAGTDDDVRIGLNDHWSNTTPHGNETWLDYPHDDFEAGSQFSYDLNLTTLEDLHDITALSIFKDGSDWWCVSHVTLIIDNDVLFEQDFSMAPDGCQWVGDNEALTFSHDDLRASETWSSFVPTGPGFVLDANDTISRIEGVVGNLAHYSELYWDEEDDGVSLSKVDDQTVHVDIETTASVNNWSDPTVRLEFDVDIDVACEPSADGSGFDVTVQFVPFNAHGSAEGFLFEVGEFFACTLQADWNCIEEEINAGAMSGLPSFDGASFQLPLCPSTVVDPNGTVTFVFE